MTRTLEQSLARLPLVIIDRGLNFWLSIEPAFAEVEEDEDIAKPNGGWLVTYRIIATTWDHAEEGTSFEPLGQVLDRMYDYLERNRFIE